MNIILLHLEAINCKGYFVKLKTREENNLKELLMTLKLISKKKIFRNLLIR